MAQALAQSLILSEASDSSQTPFIAFSLQFSSESSSVRAPTRFDMRPVAPAAGNLFEAHIVASVLPLLDVVSSASVLTDDEGKVFALNEAAAHLFARGTEVRVAQARLALSDPHAAKQLLTKLAAQRRVAIPLRQNDLITDRRHETLIETVSLKISLIRRVYCHHLSLLHLRIDDLEALRCFQMERLMAKGLTAAESRIAMALCQGASVSEYAAKATIALSTARTHLQRAMSKLGVSRQLQMVVLVGKLLRGERD